MESIPLSIDDNTFIKSWDKGTYSQFSKGRLEQFRAGRFCAVKACEKIGINLTSLAIKDNRAPLWPEKIVGSISHTKDMAICIVSKEAISVGVDIENIMTNERWNKIKSKIVSDDEETIANQNSINPTIIFSAKESLYKLINPLVNVYFDFLEAQIKNISNDSFALELKSKKQELEIKNGIYQGHFIKFENKIITYFEM